jgi:hypothetical protein
MIRETRTPFQYLLCSGHINKLEIMKTISLTKGMVTLVDDEDYENLNQFKWRAKKGSNNALNTYYAVRMSNKKDGTKYKDRYFIQMHRVIMKTLINMECDHVFHNGLDNRKFIEIDGILKINLRNCTRQQNTFNRRSHGGSKYLGVSYYKNYDCYVAQIQTNKIKKMLGYYQTEIEAAQAYDKIALQDHGEFANLNFK